MPPCAKWTNIPGFNLDSHFYIPVISFSLMGPKTLNILSHTKYQQNNYYGKPKSINGILMIITLCKNSIWIPCENWEQPNLDQHSQILITSGTWQPMPFRVLHHVLLKDTGWCVQGKWGTMRSPSLQCTMVSTPSGLWMYPPGTQQQGTVNCPLPRCTSKALGCWILH